MISKVPSTSNSVNFLAPDLKVLDVLLTPENYSYLNEFSGCFPNSANTDFFLFTPPLFGAQYVLKAPIVLSHLTTILRLQESMTLSCKILLFIPSILRACSVTPVVSDSLRPQGLQPARLLCPWDSPDKNTGVCCHFLLQGIFPNQGQNLSILHLLHCKWVLFFFFFFKSFKKFLLFSWPCHAACGIFGP